MMLAHDELRVIHVSTHVSLRQACDLCKKERVLDVIRIANEGCKALGIKEPKIGVAGLNPHCGENGMFGREEIEEYQYQAATGIRSRTRTLPDFIGTVVSFTLNLFTTAGYSENGESDEGR